MTSLLFSSIGKKLIISLSGLFLLIFLALHLLLNLTALIGSDYYENVCSFMDTNPLVKVMVPVLALGFIIHILFASYFEFKNWAARPRAMSYAVPTTTKGVSWASKNMFVLGVIVIGFLLMHFCHFWAKMQLQGFLGREESNAYELVVNLFSKWYYCVIYIVWICAIYFHVLHGFWSAFQSIGLSNANWLPRLQLFAKIYAAVIFIGYVSIPVCFLLGWHK